MPTTFSLIMTVYDTLHFLPRALACVQLQDHPQWELLVVLDGPARDDRYSPSRLLDSLRRRLPKRRLECWEVPRAEGRFGNAARHFALQHAAGDYVCWINHDNLVFPNYLSAHAANVSKTPGCVSVVDVDFWKDERYHGRYPRALSRSRIDLLNFAVPLTAARAVDAFGGDMEKVYAADWLTFDACRKRCPVEWSHVLAGVHF